MDTNSNFANSAPGPFGGASPTPFHLFSFTTISGTQSVSAESPSKALQVANQKATPFNSLVSHNTTRFRKGALTQANPAKMKIPDSPQYEKKLSIQSINGVLFDVHKEVLSLASPVLAEMIVQQEQALSRESGGIGDSVQICEQLI